jgi:hypothetical protein
MKLGPCTYDTGLRHARMTILVDLSPSEEGG